MKYMFKDRSKLTESKKAYSDINIGEMWMCKTQAYPCIMVTKDISQDFVDAIRLDSGERYRFYSANYPNTDNYIPGKFVFKRSMFNEEVAYDHEELIDNISSFVGDFILVMNKYDPTFYAVFYVFKHMDRTGTGIFCLCSSDSNTELKAYGANKSTIPFDDLYKIYKIKPETILDDLYKETIT